MVNWKTDNLGRLQLAGIHDSRMDEISISADRSIRINFLRERAISLKASGVEALNFERLWEDNIVSTVFIWHSKDVPDYLFDDPSVGWRHLFQGRMESESIIRQELERRRVKEKNLVLFTITSSYGGAISALCSDLSVY